MIYYIALGVGGLINLIFIIWFIVTLNNISSSLSSIQQSNKGIQESTELTNTLLNVLRQKGNDSDSPAAFG
jgi:uncharacterized protein YoxC